MFQKRKVKAFLNFQKRIVKQFPKTQKRKARHFSENKKRKTSMDPPYICTRVEDCGGNMNVAIYICDVARMV